MQTTYWNKRRLGIFSITILASYLLFTASNNRFESDVTIKNVKPEDVWEYVADFSKMRLLNPTMWVLWWVLFFFLVSADSRFCMRLEPILPNNKFLFSLDFTITKDHGHFHNWKYSIVYKEQLSHWPYWINIAEADFVVRKMDPMERGQYSVASEHRTCFFGGFYCCKLTIANFSRSDFILDQYYSANASAFNYVVHHQSYFQKSAPN